jgi:hypothetical protein
MMIIRAIVLSTIIKRILFLLVVLLTLFAPKKMTKKLSLEIQSISYED